MKRKTTAWFLSLAGILLSLLCPQGTARELPLENWRACHRLECTLTEEGHLKLTEIGRDSSIQVDGLSLAKDEFNTVVVTYRAQGTGNRGQLYFRAAHESYSDDRKFNLPFLKADGTWHALRVNTQALEKPESWKDQEKIYGFRLDMTDAQGGEIEIRSVEIFWDGKARPTRSREERLDSPAWPPVTPDFHPVSHEMVKTPYYAGGMISHPQDRGQPATYLLRKRFHLPCGVKRAVLVFLADDAGEVYLNGTRVLNKEGWESPATLEAGEYLHPGENLLAVQYRNLRSAGGVLVDLQVVCQDGQFLRISSDQDCKAALPPQAGWETLDFDDSQWTKAAWHEPPPGMPWNKTMPYVDIQCPQEAVGVLPDSEQWKAGDLFRARVRLKGEVPPLPTAVRLFPTLESGLALPPRYADVTRENVHREADGTWSFPVEYPLPKTLKTGRVSLKIETSREMKGELLCDFQCTEIPDAPAGATTAEMRPTPVGPRLFLDGKLRFPVIACVPRNSGPDPMDTGFRLLFPMGQWWLDEGKFDFTAFDIAMEQAQSLYPEARFLVQVACYPPPAWEQKHPQEMARTEDGRRSRHPFPETPHSFSSPRAHADLRDAVEKCVAYLEASPYADRIAGYRIIGGHTAEWIGWSHMDKWFFDYSTPAREAFAAFAASQYPTLGKAAIPSTERRMRKSPTGGDLLSTTEELDIIAYNRFSSESICDLVVDLCRAAKEACGHRKLVGTYYGYLVNLPNGPFFQGGGHFALKKMLESGAVDFLMSPPSYTVRHMGETLLDMKPFASIQANGTLSLVEDDPRTHAIPPLKSTNYDQTLNARQSLDYLKRSFGIALCRQSGILMYTFEGQFHSEFSFPEMRTLERDTSIAGQFSWERNLPRKAEIALVFSEESCFYLAGEKRSVPRNDSLRQNYNFTGGVGTFPQGATHLSGYLTSVLAADLSRCGAPVDFLLAEDLADHPGDYKLYIFANAIACDSRFRQAIQRLQERDVTMLWLYAPGYYDGLEEGVENMERLTGFRFSRHQRLPAEVRLGPEEYLGLQEDTLTPGFAVLPEDGVLCLANYTGTESCGYAERKTGKARTIFCGAYVFPTEFYRSLAKQSGVHLYGEEGDPLEAGNGFIALHTRFPGRKTILLREKADVVDVYRHRLLARDVDHFSFEAPLHSSWLFYVGPDGKELLKRLRDKE